MRRLALWAAASVLFVACQENEVMERNRLPINDLTFTTSWEEASGQGDTRTYINEKNQLRWNADDRISVFAATTENRPYRFNGETGDNSGTFSPVENATGTGSSLKKNYAVYPYREENAIAQDGSMTVVLPATQHYVANSFGLEANTMTAVTRDAYDKFLPFKNVGGYLKIFLYGKDITVKSITLCGNNGEKLAGKATVKLDAEGLPSVTMTDEATDAITLDCGSGVAIGTTIERAVAFWVVVPPTMFAKGLTVIVTDTNGDTIKKTIDSEFVVARNVIKPVNFDCDILRERLIAFYNSTGGDQWTNNTNWCSDKPLTEWYGVNFQEDYLFVEGEGYLDCWTILLLNNNLTGDAVLSDCESTGPICLFLYGNELTSIDISNSPDIRILSCPENNSLTNAIMVGCPNLWKIDVSYNQLTALDVTNCPKLSSLNCGGNQLTALDVTKCSKLQSLDCSGYVLEHNQLTALDVTNCPELQILNCNLNQLTALDVAKCPKLQTLECGSNQLTALDVTNCPKLSSLNCGGNQLTVLDVTKCPELSELYCSKNPLTALDVTNCPKLSSLNCGGNQLTVLDVTNCPKLSSLNCGGNQLTVLDVTNCPKLQQLSCDDNQLTVLDLSANSELYFLNCCGNRYIELDLSHNHLIKDLSCGDNDLRVLNLSGNTAIEWLYCSNNQLSNIIGFWPCLNTLKHFSCTSNKITCEIPAEYAQLWYTKASNNALWYNARYSYYKVEYDDGSYEYKYKDYGVGWWYPGEPEKRYHRPD